MRDTFKRMVWDAINKTIEQEEQSVNDAGGCMYKGNNNTCCVIGHMIPDSRYVREMDHPVDSSDTGIMRNIPVQEVLGFNKEELEISRSLQRCHDSASVIKFTKTFIQKIESYIKDERLPEWIGEYSSNTL